ncbi:MAG: class I SAM-dependent methyltransferase [Chloroflexi bacterium]|nr:MAG: class I SAM-dependent methyltransferase [Chloroflexota bacterium]
MNPVSSDNLWDSFWAVHASSDDLFHYLLWRIRFLFSSAYARKIAHFTGKIPAAKLLEVGCGSARTLHYLDAHYDNGSKCYALDLSPQAIQVVRKVSPGFRAWVASAFYLPIRKDALDVSFSIGLIEHFSREQAAQIVSEKIRVTRPGGVVGIVVPWQNSVYNLVVRKAFGKHWPFGDENPFRRKELALFMQNLGLEGVKIHVIYGSTLIGIGRKIS